MPNLGEFPTPAEVARAAIDWFAAQEHDASFSVFYENTIPKMKYELRAGNVDFVGMYRLDILLEPFYADAEQIFDENVRTHYVEAELRDLLVPMIAFSGMTMMLSRLLILQAQIFLENDDEAQLTTAGVFLHSLVSQSPHKKALGRSASKVIQRWIDKSVAATLKKKRDFLVGFMNKQPLLQIPTGVGRPLGSTKSEEKKQQEAKEFALHIQATVKSLFASTEKMPTKTAVAEALGLGGINRDTGTDSRLNSFNNKLARLGIDYAKLLQGLKLYG